MSIKNRLIAAENYLYWSISKNRSFTKKESARLFFRYGSFPRYQEKRIAFTTRTEKKHTYIVPDAASFLSMYKSIFAEECYNFSEKNEKKLTILDFGANIGMSVLYFYESYPNANIYGFEADPRIFGYLEKNIASFSRNDGRIKLYNKAVWTEETELTFSSDGSDGGRISDKAAAKTRVQAVDVRKIMEEHDHIDFLKIDIEGSERNVVPALGDYFKKVDKLFLEYHSEADKPQCLSQIIGILNDAGYRLYISDSYRKNQPYTGLDMFEGYDNLLEIFAVRQVREEV